MTVSWPPAFALLLHVVALAAEPDSSNEEPDPSALVSGLSDEQAEERDAPTPTAPTPTPPPAPLEEAEPDDVQESTGSDAPPLSGAEVSTDCSCEAPPRRFSSIALVEGVAHYGGVSRGEDLSDPDAAEETYRAGLVGGQVTLGVMPGGRHFTMAGRIRGGAYLGGGSQLATMGAAMLFGANFLRDETGRSFGYVLGGVGVEFLPGLNQDMLTLHIAGGTIVRGFNFSAGLDLGGNDQIAHAMIGFQIGWGQLF